MLKLRSCLPLAGVVSIALLGQPVSARVGDKCGGMAGAACSLKEFCEHRPGICPVSDADGTCVSRPEVCAQIYAPVCGCDGKTYGNDCARRTAGVSKAHDGKCP